MTICSTDIEKNCDVCYEVARADSDLTFIYGLTPSTQYYLWVIDKFNTSYKKLFTSGIDGSFTIDPTDEAYPGGLFNTYAGDLEVFISSDASGDTVIPMVIYATNYNCVLLTITSTIYSGCDVSTPGCDPAFITDSDGITIFEVDSGGSGTCTPVASKSGIAYQRPQLTGLYASSRTGDDGYNLQNGIYDYTAPEYPVSFAKLDTASLTPFPVLLSNNAFGNKNRFTDENGLQVFGNAYFIDHLTGLGWLITKQASMIWNTAIDTALSSTAYIYTDWRMSNFNELHGLMDFRLGNTMEYTPFSDFSQELNTGEDAWTSTTDQLSTTLAFTIRSKNSSTQSYNVVRLAKSTSQVYYICRNHYT